MEYLIYTAVAASLCALLAAANGKARARALEARIDGLTQAAESQLGLTSQIVLDNQLLAMREAGLLIHAIKFYRDRTGCDIKAAKSYVVALRPIAQRGTAG